MNSTVNHFEDRWLLVGNGTRKLLASYRPSSLTSDLAPVLFLIHGVTRRWRDWEPMIPFLSPHWTIFAIDQRGHGLSDRADSYFVLDYANDMVEILQQKTQASPPVVLAGHSLGAMVAAYAAAVVPEQVRAVILEDPPFQSMGNAIAGSTWQALFRGMQQVCKDAASPPNPDNLTAGMSTEAIAALLSEVVVATASDNTPIRLRDVRNKEALLWSAACLKNVDPKVFDALVAGSWLNGYSPEDIAPKLKCPVSLLQADPKAGGALSDAEAQAFAHQAKNCELKKFPGKNHQLHGTVPQEIAAAINRFLPEN
jgi:pimeloyl-ACP methyl ester carboxylesterase